MSGNPRRRNGSRRDKVLARVRARDRVCWICGHPLDPAARYPSPLCTVGDELETVKAGGSPFDPANVAGAHRCCNAWRGAKEKDRVQVVQSLVASRFGGSRDPLDFCAKARTLVRNPAAGRSMEPPRTTTRW